MRLSFFGFNFTSCLLVTTTTLAMLATLQTSVVADKSSQEIARIAQTTTVEINNPSGDPGGTGVIVAKQGNTYTILTANHVVIRPDIPYTIRTSQAKDYPIMKVQRLQPTNNGVDLALVTFSAPDNYLSATLGNSDQAAIGSPIYVGGYPLPGLGQGNERNFAFSGGMVTSRLKENSKGYTLRYDAVTRKGMSGGPVFDILGRVVGVHGQGDSDAQVLDEVSGANISIKTGFNAGIPINIFIAIKPSAEINPVVDNQPTGDNPAARLSNPQSAKDYASRATIRQDEGNTQGAIEDFNQAIALNTNDASVYFKRGVVLYNKNDFEGALADFDRAINLDPNYADAYFNRGYIRYYQNDGQRALADFDKYVNLVPNEVLGWENRAKIRRSLGDLEGTVADLDQVLRLSPNHAKAYFTRGIVRKDLQDWEGAVEDLQKAADLYKQNGLEVGSNQRFYQKALEIIQSIQSASGNSGSPQLETGNESPKSTSDNSRR